VEFFCHGTRYKECTCYVYIEDLPEDVNGVVAGVAFSRDSGAGYETTDWVAELVCDRIECEVYAGFILYVELMIRNASAVSFGSFFGYC
jgi:hypothetical protein